MESSAATKGARCQSSDGQCRLRSPLSRSDGLGHSAMMLVPFRDDTHADHAVTLILFLVRVWPGDHC